MNQLPKYLFLFFAFVIHLRVNAQTQLTERAEWFVEDRFGMFIHWGLYSGAEGFWKGEKLRYDNDYAEWIQYRNRIPKDEYLQLAGRFDWEAIDVEEWVLLAKEAGMKYVTLTAKHHDGFALWDSKVSTYDVGQVTQPKRDIVKELNEACKKHGLKMGLYYSHWIDWEHEYGWSHRNEIEPLSPKNYDQYWQEKVIPQVRELLTNYEVDLFWFDMWVNHPNTIVSKEQLLQLKNMIREIRPNCLVNSRLGLSIEEDPDVDFRTLGDNQLGNEKLDYPWQTPATVAHSWGFHAQENEWKSTTTLLRNLVGNVALNGNMMLNIGPRANGELPYEIEQRLKQMGDWLKQNGEAIYGAGAFDLPSDLHDWGAITAKETEEGKYRIYAHVFNWPLSKHLPITGIQQKPSRVFLLENERALLPFVYHEFETIIQLPEEAMNPYISVVVLEYDQKPTAQQKLVAKSVYGGYSLTPWNAYKFYGTATTEKAENFGSVPKHVKIKEKQQYFWKVNISQPTTLSFTTSYSCQEKKPTGSLKVKVNNHELSGSLQPTGKTVGEPKQDWVIDQFLQFSLGSMQLNQKGVVEIELEIEPAEGQELDFQWLWINQKESK